MLFRKSFNILKRDLAKEYIRYTRKICETVKTTCSTAQKYLISSKKIRAKELLTRKRIRITQKKSIYRRGLYNLSPKENKKILENLQLENPSMRIYDITFQNLV